MWMHGCWGGQDRTVTAPPLASLSASRSRNISRRNSSWGDIVYNTEYRSINSFMLVLLVLLLVLLVLLLGDVYTKWSGCGVNISGKQIW